MGHQHLYGIHLRKFSQASPFGRVCSIQWGLIWKRGLSMCRQCFHLYAKDIGFIKQDQRNFLEWVIQDIYYTRETMLALRT
ncbi:40S ribosomal protein S29-like [Eptesicus fuscus]|uniref:40S ribosomal protein S29-like n=1 Tax=Eptesicus fuscus TaxID=29078 RepID=UPI002404154A|nr:40S ribosomal protein S29-like [Eptesicus fuscus]